MRQAAVALVLSLVLSACSGDDLVQPQTGTLEITTVVTGIAPAVGYTIKIDNETPQSIGHNAMAQRTGIPTGSHTVELGAVPSGCTTAGENPRTVTVTAGTTTAVTFMVACASTTGAIRVVTTSTGEAPASYGLILDGGSQGPITSNGTRILEGVSPGTHLVDLSDIPGHCEVQESSSRSVAVSAEATTDVAFVLACDGLSGWSLHPTGSNVALWLSGVWGSSGTDVYAVGTYEAGATVAEIRHHDGVSWSSVFARENAGLRGIWGSSRHDVFAVGSSLSGEGTDGVIVHYDGSTWTPMTPPVVGSENQIYTGSYTSVWGSSGTDVFAVGQEYQGPGPSITALVAHYDGARWSKVTLPFADSHSLTDVHGTSTRDVWVVGVYSGPSDGGAAIQTSVIWHYDGLSWGEQPRWLLNTNISGVWAKSATSVFAVGGAYDDNTETGAVFRYDGATWSRMTVPRTGYLRDVWGTSENDVYAVGQDGILHFDGSTWTDMGVDRALYDIWGASATDVFAVGNGTILHGPP